MNREGDVTNTYSVLDKNVEILNLTNNTSDKLNIMKRKVNVDWMYLKLAVSLVVFFFLSAIIINGYFFMFDNEESCTPFQPVDKVTVRLVEAQGYSCHDNTTCGSLLRRIEQEQDGLRYNFVIGSDMELYIGLGFKCRVNRHLDELHIKLITPDLLCNSTLAEGAFRVFHIIDEGLKCDGDEPGCPSAVQYMDGIGDLDKMVHQSFDSMAHHTIHSPTSESGIILHKAFRWTACGEASYEAKNITWGKVITLDSLQRQSCQPYKPVDHIHFDFVIEPLYSNCSDSSCSNLIPYIESHHDGFKYNFLIDEEGYLYIGLGFRCQANQTQITSLKIKVIKRYFAFNYTILTRIGEIIKEGLECHKILENYTMSQTINGEVEEDPDVMWFKRYRSPSFLDLLSSRFRKRLQDFNHHTDGHVKMIPHSRSLVVCDRPYNYTDNFTLWQ